MVIDNNPTPDEEVDPISILLEVKEGDISEMDYKLNGAMSNRPSDNAVTLALRQITRTDLNVTVRVQDGVAYAYISDKAFQMDERLGDWLIRAYLGHRVRPIKTEIKLPASVIRSEFRSKQSPGSMGSTSTEEPLESSRQHFRNTTLTTT